MTDTEFDKLLRSALMEAVRLDFQPVMEAAEQEEIIFSRRYLKRREKMLQDPFAYAKKAGLSLWQRAARTVAMILLVCSILFAVMWSVPEVRAAIRKLYMEWYETYIAVYVQDDTGAGETDLSKFHVEIPENVLPEGYEEILRDEYAGAILYATEIGETILVDYRYTGNEHEVEANSEGMIEQEQVVDGVAFYKFESKDDEKANRIMWFNEEYSLALGITAPKEFGMTKSIVLAQNILVEKKQN